ncbi:hypothetical protein SteCoe_33353 [Stentor coeruleus]|uniref:G domain-containing protein n=1 Tax=Stentor coeruleus TaxID=5963 RepID=A0A1R2AXD3_9CILI|nr:hypothetical protein SteCoe_33353 [Stentor coeruleus]
MNSTFARAVRKSDIEPYDYSVLIIGETGVGKSTLLNVIVNSVFGNNVENLTAAIRCLKYPNINPEFDDKIYERNDANTLRSQTTNVHYYKVSGPLTNNKILLFVDTPGMSSTEGIEEDDESTNEIIDCAKSVKHFNAIICMLKYSTNRFTPFLKYNIQRISEIIPRDFENSVIVVSSFKCGSGKSSEVRNIDYPFPVQNFYFLNNVVFENTREEYLAKPKLLKKSNKQFKKIKTKVGKMFEFIFKMNAISSMQYDELFFRHNNIMTIISELNTHMNNFDAIKKFIYTNEVIDVTRWVDTNYHNTLCSLHSDKVCHENCFLNFTRVKNSKYFNDCACMNLEKKCKICGCESEQHLHKRQKPVYGPLQIEDILKYYSIPITLKNPDKALKMIDIKREKLLLELHTNEIIISEINPRYILTDHFHKAIELMEATDTSKIRSKNIKNNLENLKTLENLTKRPNILN